MTVTQQPVTTSTLVVSEVFGPTVQGEGPSTGRRAGFVRLGGCNLSCSWCDSAYTWDAGRFDLRDELQRRPVKEIAARALQGDPSLVVLSGGEPLLHQIQPGWLALLDALAGVDVEIETNGTVMPNEATLARRPRFNVSPKLAHSGDPLDARIRPKQLQGLVATARAVFKFVCATEEDVAEVAVLARSLGIPSGLVWISPEGTDVEAVLTHTKIIAEATIAAGFNLGTRLHTLVWGNERAR